MAVKRKKGVRVLRISNREMAEMAGVSVSKLLRDSRRGLVDRGDMGSVINYVRWRRRSGVFYCPDCGSRLELGRE